MCEAHTTTSAPPHAPTLLPRMRRGNGRESRVAYVQNDSRGMQRVTAMRDEPRTICSDRPSAHGAGTHHGAMPSASSLNVCIIAASVTSIATSMPNTPSFVCAARNTPPSAINVSVSGCVSSNAEMIVAENVHHVTVWKGDRVGHGYGRGRAHARWVGCAWADHTRETTSSAAR